MMKRLKSLLVIGCAIINIVSSNHAYAHHTPWDESLLNVATAVRQKYSTNAIQVTLLQENPIQNFGDLYLVNKKAQIMLQFLSAPEGDILLNEWVRIINLTSSESVYESILPTLEQIESSFLFSQISKGDTLMIDYSPTKGTRIFHNFKVVVETTNEHLYFAILNAFISDHLSNKNFIRRLEDSIKANQPNSQSISLAQRPRQGVQNTSNASL